MEIKWVQWFNVPMHRRLEVLSLSICMLIGPIVFMCITMPVYLLIAGNIYWKIVWTLYFAFFFYDLKTGDQGGRGAGYAWVRSWRIWKHTKNYFPIDLVKTADLTPDRNYLICAFPHGYFSFGAAGNFGTNYSKWSTFYPGIRPKIATLSFNTLWPVLRELFLNTGFCSASANSLTTLLNQSNDPADKSNQDGYTANAVALIVGGAREARLYTYPNKYKFVLKTRRGFARIALKTGASLVPAISFGENNYFDVINYKPGWFKRIFKNVDYCSPLPIGRGYFQYNYGFLPRRHPITTVIGAPIPVEKIPNPSDEDIYKVHDIFCTRIIELFEEHKHKYVENFENIHVELV